MSEQASNKTFKLLEKLTNYVIKELPTRQEVDGKIDKVDGKIDKLAEYVMNEVPRKDEVPTKQEMNQRFEQVDKQFEHIELRLDRVEDDVKETKQDVKLILDGMDSQVKENEILKTEQITLKSGLARV